MVSAGAGAAAARRGEQGHTRAAGAGPGGALLRHRGHPRPRRWARQARALRMRHHLAGATPLSLRVGLGEGEGAGAARGGHPRGPTLPSLCTLSLDARVLVLVRVQLKRPAEREPTIQLSLFTARFTLTPPAWSKTATLTPARCGFSQTGSVAPEVPSAAMAKVYSNVDGLRYNDGRYDSTMPVRRRPPYQPGHLMPASLKPGLSFQ